MWRRTKCTSAPLLRAETSRAHALCLPTTSVVRRNSEPAREEERLTRISAHSNARRVNYRQAHLVATLVCDGAGLTKPALPIPRAFGTDLGGGLDSTPLAAYLRCLVSGQ